MKARITGKPATKKTIEEMHNELIMNDMKRDLENLELEKINKSGKKKVVDNETYFENLDASDCRYCMNYNFDTDSCKKNMPNIDPWYTKDNGLFDECEEWDYIYEQDDINE